MAIWIIGGFILALGAGITTLLWWRLGDQWADDEYKKFGHGGGRPRVEGDGPIVIKTRTEDSQR
ncbi:MAG: hypothetical protein D6692_07660 [Planctomycetota bacterium]|nr:MAG: hypothetical protein D6692_07660 [Planctomycetota bacterium]